MIKIRSQERRVSLREFRLNKILKMMMRVTMMRVMMMRIRSKLPSNNKQEKQIKRQLKAKKLKTSQRWRDAPAFGSKLTSQRKIKTRKNFYNKSKLSYKMSIYRKTKLVNNTKKEISKSL